MPYDALPRALRAGGGTSHDRHREPTGHPHDARPEVRPGQLFIAGQWREAADGGRTDVIDPSTGQTVATVAAGTAEDVAAAVTAARAAFPAWRETPARERAASCTGFRH